VFDVGIKGKPHDFGNLRHAVGQSSDLDAFRMFIDSQLDASVTWKDIEWLRSQWSGRIIIKGVMSAQDARSAVAAGADGVVVSNHGGRQLEGVSSSISTLPGIVEAVGGETEVLMDGGVRSGSDVVKALALGARGVMIGRPWVWAMAARGEEGLVNLLDVYQREIANAMGLMGVNRIDEITPELVDCSFGT
jgi:L-lactate dehydrogenase (cytochrome)